MADIEIIFATNAASVARDVDQATQSTNKASIAADSFNKNAFNIEGAASKASRGLRGLGDAARLFEFAGAGMAREAGGLIHILTSLAGPYGAAAAAGIAAIGVAFHFSSENTKEMAKATEEAKKRLEELTKAKEEATKAFAAEGNESFKKYGQAIRAAIYNGTDPLAGKSPAERALTERGMSPEEAAGSAASRAAYAERGGMFPARQVSNNFNWATGQGSANTKTMARFNATSRGEEAAETEQKSKLVNGQYAEAIKDNTSATKDLQDEYRISREQLAGGKEKGGELKTVPLSFMQNVLYGWWN